MADGEGKGGALIDPWLLVFIVAAAALFFGRGESDGIFGTPGGVRFGSPSRTGTVEEEISNRSQSSFFSPSSNPPPAPPPATPPSGTIFQPTRNDLTMEAFGSTRLDYGSEHVQISAPSTNRSRVVVTGLTLKNRQNETARIGLDEFGNSIILNPGEKAIVATGPSPRGSNFKVNKCSGYLSQTSAYSPSLNFFCPHIQDIGNIKQYSQKCEQYIRSLPYCTTPVFNFQTGIENECAAFISQHASYAGCVNDFKNDRDFDKKEWRIFLNRSREFWDNRTEMVQLLNQSGVLIANTSY